jgi:hypothetical protein
MSALDQEADIPGSSTPVCKNPAEIPFHQPTKFQFIINTKAALTRGPLEHFRNSAAYLAKPK